MAPPRKVAICEVLKAARDGVLTQTGDAVCAWYEINGVHIPLHPVDAMLADGVLALECTVDIPRKITLTTGILTEEKIS